MFTEHGGGAELVAVDDDEIILRLVGNCVGCGMAGVHFGVGMEQMIRRKIPPSGASPIRIKKFETKSSAGCTMAEKPELDRHRDRWGFRKRTGGRARRREKRKTRPGYCDTITTQGGLRVYHRAILKPEEIHKESDQFIGVHFQPRSLRKAT